MPNMDEFLKNAVGTDLFNQWTSASNLSAAKYVPFDNSYGWNDFWSPGSKYSKDRVSNWINEVLNRQYEMDVRKQEIDLQNSAYQRAVSDMKKAGLNPYWLESLTASASSLSSPSRVDNPQIVKKNNDKTYDISQSLLKLATSALMFLILAG